jgi:ankyrin repeat protein
MRLKKISLILLFVSLSHPLESVKKLSGTEKQLVLNYRLAKAVNDKDRRTVISLLKRGAEATARDEHYEPAITNAALDGKVSMIKLLLDNGADKEAPSFQYDYKTPLSCAVMGKNVPVVRFLLEQGALIESSGLYHETPLHVAASNPYCPIKILQLLLDYGAKLEAKDKYGRTPLSLTAITTGCKCTAEYLMERGAAVNICDKYGYTPLYRAAELGKGEVTEVLLRYGADPAIACRDWTPSQGVEFILSQATFRGAVERESYQKILCMLNDY